MTDVMREIARLFTAFGAELEPARVSEYRNALSDFSDDTVAEGVRWIIKNHESSFVPKPNEVYRACRLIRTEAIREAEHEQDWRSTAVECSICNDTAYVTVWLPSAMRAAIEFLAGRMDEAKFRCEARHAAARCTCPKSQKRRKPESTYRPNVHVIVPRGSIETHVESLLEWARNWKPRTFCAELASFNAD